MNWRRSGGANRRTWISSKAERVAKEELFVIEGQIDEILPDGRFRVLLDNEQRIIASTAGTMRRYPIRSVVADRVPVEMTPFDLAQGRLIFRHRPPGACPGVARHTRRHLNSVVQATSVPMRVHNWGR